jgi:hypothetical protein
MLRELCGAARRTAEALVAAVLEGASASMSSLGRSILRWEKVDTLRAERDEAICQIADAHRRALVILQEEMERRPDVSDDEKQVVNAAWLRLAEELGRLESGG